ncbi:hypothetical protein LCGC14_2709370, partial [marine sediment metagenome]
MVVPTNVTGSSCFCDVMIVAMFLSTNFYDRILYETELFEFQWVNVELIEEKENIEWIKFLINDIKRSACFETQKVILQKKKISDKKLENLTEETTKTLMKEFQNILIDTVRIMRNPIFEKRYIILSNVISQNITSLRIKLRDSCGRGQPSGLFQEDTVEFFNSIMAIGNWETVYLSIIKEIKEYSFEFKIRNENIFKNVKPLIKFDIEPPGIFKLLILKNLGELQKLITTYFEKKEENTQEISFKELPESYKNYIFSKDPDSLSKIESDQKMKIIEKTSRILIRIPDVFVFTLGRITEENTKISTNISIPANEILFIPVLRNSNIKKYKIQAIICQRGDVTGGHYLLYFKFKNKDKDADAW